MYKDKDKQREAVRLATQRYRQKLKGITSVTDNVIPGQVQAVIPKPIPKPVPEKIEPQSYSSMIVGYVPKTEA